MDINEITGAIQELDNWGLENNSIEKTFEFPDFIRSVSFVNKLADLAEEHKHHPDLMISGGKVTVRLQTHSVNALTEKDIEMAKAIDEMMRQI